MTVAALVVDLRRRYALGPPWRRRRAWRRRLVARTGTGPRILSAPWWDVPLFELVLAPLVVARRAWRRRRQKEARAPAAVLPLHARDARRGP